MFGHVSTAVTGPLDFSRWVRCCWRVRCLVSWIRCLCSLLGRQWMLVVLYASVASSTLERAGHAATAVFVALSPKSQHELMSPKNQSWEIGSLLSVGVPVSHSFRAGWAHKLRVHRPEPGVRSSERSSEMRPSVRSCFVSASA